MFVSLTSRSFLAFLGLERSASGGCYTGSHHLHFVGGVAGQESQTALVTGLVIGLGERVGRPRPGGGDWGAMSVRRTVPVGTMSVHAESIHAMPVCRRKTQLHMSSSSTSLNTNCAAS